MPLLRSILQLRLRFYPLRYFVFLLKVRGFSADFSKLSNGAVLLVPAYLNISNDEFPARNYTLYWLE